jgi:hypothetical protein
VLENGGKLLSGSKRQINAAKSIISAEFAMRRSQKAPKIRQLLARAVSSWGKRRDQKVIEDQGLSDEIASPV